MASAHVQILEFSDQKPCWNSVGTYLFKVNNGNTRAMFEVCSKFKSKTPKWHHWRRSGAFIVNFEQISHIILVFPLLTLKKYILAGNRTDLWVIWEIYERYIWVIGSGGHSFSTYAKCSEKLTFTPWYTHIHVCIRGKEMLVFRKILRRY